MKLGTAASAFLTAFLACVVVLLGFAAPSHAQTATTGALTGTVSDPSGGVIASATVTLTNVGTGQSRTATTDASGSYKFSLIPPGTYRVNFTASGFKSTEVPSITVNVTETPVLDQKLEIGGQTTEVTVESAAETIQTQNATTGQVVGSQEIVDLPLVSRNYTQIADLSPGVVTNVSNASAVGNGTQDINVNGSRANQNNYSMDGASVVNYVSGTASQEGSFPGIAIPNPDTIQEFKVQTSQYDAGYGRNPGANVSVVTKGGQNDFHGTAFEFNRNNMFNANDFFYHYSEIRNDEPNKPQILKQNTFGGTLGGRIIKDKLFFFGSYQGFRQINGIGTSGFASGYESATVLLPWNDYADFQSGACSDLRCSNNVAAYRTYLGSVFGGEKGDSTGVVIAPNGSNISNTIIGLLQAPGILKGGYNQGFYFPSATQACGASPSGCVTAISQPTIANENQYMGNSDWLINSKNTLHERYLYSSDPQVQSFLCFITPNSCNPGAPEDVNYSSHTATLSLTTILTSNLVNDARITYQRNVENATDPNIVHSCDISSTANVIPLINSGAACPGAAATPLNEEQNIVPIIDVLGIASPSGGWGEGGNFSATSQNFINTWQAADQMSWNHGKQTFRFGFDAERIYYNNTIFASSRGEVLFDTVADLLTSSAGPAGTNPLDPTYNDGTPATVVTAGSATQLGPCFFNQGFLCGGGADPIALKGNLTHHDNINAFDGFAQDDIKVSRKLTVNLGVRWEYDGWPDDTAGQFSDDWQNLAAQVNTGSFFLGQAICPGTGNPVGTLAGFVVPTNFDVKQFGLTGPCGASGVKSTGTKTLFPGSPWHNFAPRLGVAWQPLGEKLVVRAGYGLFYDRVYGNLLIDNQLNLPPYASTAVGPFPSSLEGTLHNPYQSVAGVPLEWTPRWLECTDPTTVPPAPTPCTSGAINGTTPNSFASSGFGYSSDSPEMANRLPLIQEYNLDFQYEFAHGWVADIGYVGSHSIHLYNYGQDLNIAGLVAGAPNEPVDPQNAALITSSLPFNDPANATPVTTNTTLNTDARVRYLGYGPTGFFTTTTAGDGLYNSLQAELRHQFSHGLLLQASYTWSRNITNIDTSLAGNGIQAPGQVVNGASNSNNPLDLGQQYGPAAFNRAQRLVVSYAYNLPWKHTEGFVGHALSGWTISGITTVQSGEPFTVVDGGGGSIYGVATSRAALASPGSCSHDGNCNSSIPIATSGSTKQRVLEGLPDSPEYTGVGWINPDAFISLSPATYAPIPGVPPANPALPFVPLPASSPYCIGGVPNGAGSAGAACGSGGATFVDAGSGYGNSEVGSITGPGQWNSDLSLIKMTKITEGTALEFRAEFYNIWNHAQFNPPSGNDINTPSTFGVVDSSSVTPRVVQFALKFHF